MRLLMTSMLIYLCLSTIADAKVLFKASVTKDGPSGIFTMADDGSNIAPLIGPDGSGPGYARWSPNGKKILFKKFEIGVGRAFFLMNLDGTDQQQLTIRDKRLNSEYDGGEFSPDGTAIVFSYTHYVEIPGGRGPKVALQIFYLKDNRIETIADDTRATAKDWSPDGKNIVFATGRSIGGGGTTLWIIRANGTNLRPLIPEPAADPAGLIVHRWYPKWSPDGQKILYTEKEYIWETFRDEENNRNIIALIHKAHRYLIRSKNVGSTVQELKIPKDLECMSMDWMDDGKSVIFCAHQVQLNTRPVIGEGRPRGIIYKYDLATSEITQLTHNSWYYETVDWISDDVLSVTPLGKKKVRWGMLKQ